MSFNLNTFNRRPRRSHRPEASYIAFISSTTCSLTVRPSLVTKKVPVDLHDARMSWLRFPASDISSTERIDKSDGVSISCRISPHGCPYEENQAVPSSRIQTASQPPALPTRHSTTRSHPPPCSRCARCRRRSVSLSNPQGIRHLIKPHETADRFFAERSRTSCKAVDRRHVSRWKGRTRNPRRYRRPI